MWSAGLPILRKRNSLNAAILVFRRVNLVGYSSMMSANIAKDDDEGTSLIHEPMSLAKSLACLIDESPIQIEDKCWTQMDIKRSREIRIKKRVKEQYTDGKFHNLMAKVIANPSTLQDAYDCVRLMSNVELTSDHGGLCFSSMAEQLASGEFNVNANTFSMSRKIGGNKECLVLPNLKLKVVQEAIRIAVEVVYRPHFSKISHGCRSGRGPHTALRYICKEIRKPDWWFTLSMQKMVDASVLAKLIEVMEEKIEDSRLYSILHQMFDARVLNLEFGGYPKGQGFPQEGVLSPILMNIYLGLFDLEFYRICMRREGLGSDLNGIGDSKHSNLRRWFRRQMKDDDGDDVVNAEENLGSRLYSCRYMDEIFVSVSGSKDVAVDLKVEIENYLKNSLFLDVDDTTEILRADSPRGLQFLGMVVRRNVNESPAVRAVHKLKDKITSFALQKQELWDYGTVRIGNKCLAHGLKKVKESEIDQLRDKSSVLDQISCFRKDGMKTDHWFKFLLKVWLQDVNARAEDNEKEVLAKYIGEPALPKDLRDSFHNFQKAVHEYITSETAAILALLPNSSSDTGSNTSTTKVAAPISIIKKSLFRYGLISSQGFPRPVSALVLQDDIQIVYWFSGLTRRLIRWYHEYDYSEKFIIAECVRNSCIRTLAAKHRMTEAEVERRFESELCEIPSNEDSDLGMTTPNFQLLDDDKALMYGVSYSGLCMLSLARVTSLSRPCNCFVMGCSASAPNVYTLHVKERRKFPGWKTGFSTAIHPSLKQRRIGLCKQHVKDLYLGHISLQSIDFGALSR